MFSTYPVYIPFIGCFDKTDTFKHSDGLRIERVNPRMDLTSILNFRQLDQGVDHMAADMSILIRFGDDDSDFTIVLQTHIATQSIVVFDIKQIAMMIQITIHPFQSI